MLMFDCPVLIFPLWHLASWAAHEHWHKRRSRQEMNKQVGDFLFFVCFCFSWQQQEHAFDSNWLLIWITKLAHYSTHCNKKVIWVLSIDNYWMDCLKSRYKPSRFQHDKLEYLNLAPSLVKSFSLFNTLWPLITLLHSAHCTDAFLRWHF